MLRNINLAIVAGMLLISAGTGFAGKSDAPKGCTKECIAACQKAGKCVCADCAKTCGADCKCAAKAKACPAAGKCCGK